MTDTPEDELSTIKPIETSLIVGDTPARYDWRARGKAIERAVNYARAKGLDAHQYTEAVDAQSGLADYIEEQDKRIEAALAVLDKGEYVVASSALAAILRGEKAP